MNLFVCGTAYQLLNAISIAQSLDEKSDMIFICKEMDNVCDAGLLKEYCFFNEVYSWYDVSRIVNNEGVSNKASYIVNNIKKILIYLRWKSEIKKLPNKDCEYKKIYVGYPDYPAHMIYYYFKNMCNAELAFYEDGTYSYKCLEVRNSKTRAMISKTMFGSEIFDDCSEIWVHKTDFVATNGNKIKVNTITTSFDKNRNEILKVYKFNNEIQTLLDASIIYFDPNIEYDKLIEFQNESLQIMNKISDGKVVIKVHPSALKNFYDPAITQVATRIPFEILIGLMNDIEKKTLVSFFSSACFTPKLIYDYEPRVVLMFKLYDLTTTNMNVEAYLDEANRLIDMYSDKSKVIIPETMKEFSDIWKE